MDKRTRGILIGSGIAAVGVGAMGAAHRAVAGYLVRVALDRELPRHTGGSERRLSGSAGNEAVLRLLDTAAEKLENSGCETVEITGRDGTKLMGHWQASEDARRVIVAMHGWRSSWSHDFGVIAPFWQENRCSVLYAEQRGQGGSGGAYMGFGLTERYDCLEWARWVNERTGKKLPVYLAGVSMGAATVLMAAGLALPDNVCGIAADCGYTSARAVWEHVARNNLHISYGLYSAAANALCRKKIRMGPEDYSCVDAMRECKVPVLFIHGSDDRFVPIEMTYENYKACAGQKRLLVVPGAEHGMSYLVDPAGYEAAVLQFWEDCDGRCPGGTAE